MEFLALLIWLMLAGTASVLAPFAFTTPGAGLSALGAFGGATACALFIALDAPLWTAWAQVAFAFLGMLGGTIAAAQLNDDRYGTGSVTEQLQASAVGLQLPFYGAVAFVSLLMALQFTDPIV